MGLSLRGHRVHVIASAPPSRTLPTVRAALPARGLGARATPRCSTRRTRWRWPRASSDRRRPRARRLARALRRPARRERLSRPAGAGSRRARVVTTLHGTDVTQIGSDPSYRSVTRFTVTRSDGVTVPSEFLKSEAYRRLGVPADLPIEVIPNFVDVRPLHAPRHGAIARASTRCSIPRAATRRTGAPRCSFTCRASARSSASPTSSTSWRACAVTRGRG